MTREEAIADIRDNIKPVVGGISLDMAIRSLEAWEKVKEEINNIDCPYSSNPYKASKVKEESLRIIDKHLKEVEHGIN